VKKQGLNRILFKATHGVGKQTKKDYKKERKCCFINSQIQIALSEA
jgi:hypothetical protein